MTPLEKKQYTKLLKVEFFQNCIKKLTLDEELNYREKVYLLEISLLFAKQYKNDTRFRSYRDFAYYIILKYSLTYNDYKALYDFSIECGFYPIASEIIDKELLSEYAINDVLLGNTLETYRTEDKYIEILEQYNVKKSLLNTPFDEIAYIAPTSYGKSSVMIDLIKQYDFSELKIGIIVPSKSLLHQTYKMIKSSILNKRLLIHDDMYDDSINSFICIFTQERALRLLNRTSTYFDILFIDEAHNLLAYNARSILLSRLIKKNYHKNNAQKVIYLSPLIDNTKSLKVSTNQNIIKKSIDFNVKETEIYEYKESYQYKYNRFLNQLYKCDGKEFQDYTSYINMNAKNKNFIYLTSPRRIEDFSEELTKKLPNIVDDKIESLISILEENIHIDFKVIELLRKGVLYIHGQMPDVVKEYLEKKYLEIENLKFIVANKVILEGMNLPIDNLFVLNLSYLDEKDIVNLIGRVNRLNTIFGQKSNQLNKLLPSVHFINSQYGNKMSSKIKKLRSSIFEDRVGNPLLNSFDIEGLDKKIENTNDPEKKEKAEKFKERIINLINNEKYLEKATDNILVEIKQYCIEHDIVKYTKKGQIYDRFDDPINETVKKIVRKIKLIKKYQNTWGKYSIMKKVQWLFIKQMNVKEFEFKRLEYEETRKFYNGQIARNHQNSLKENIISMYEHFKKIIKDVNKSNDFYMGEPYGDFEKGTRQYQYGKFNVYVDLSEKSDKDLINLAIVKLKMEETFINFTLAKFIEMMYKYHLITDEEYNLFTYGTKQISHLKLMQYGISFNLIRRLEKDNQLENITFNKVGNLVPKATFLHYLKSLDDDFYKFQIEKYI